MISPSTARLDERPPPAGRPEMSFTSYLDTIEPGGLAARG
jgi:hypothetical protein